MRMRILSLSLLAAVFAVAQEQKAPEPPAPPVSKEPMVSAIIPVKTLTGDAFQRLTRLLNTFNVRFNGDDRLRTILVYAPKDIVEQMKRVVAELDRPDSLAAVGRNIDLTLSFLRCSLKGEAAALPADLEPVAKQLRAATAYKRIELWESLPLRIQEGKNAMQRVRLPGTIEGIPSAMTTAVIQLYPESVSQRDGTRSVRFDRFQIQFNLPIVVSAPHFQTQEMQLNTSGDFKEGQKTVIGKVGVDDDTAVFVVVTLKVID